MEPTTDTTDTEHERTDQPPPPPTLVETTQWWAHWLAASAEAQALAPGACALQPRGVVFQIQNRARVLANAVHGPWASTDETGLSGAPTFARMREMLRQASGLGALALTLAADIRTQLLHRERSADPVDSPLPETQTPGDRAALVHALGYHFQGGLGVRDDSSVHSFLDRFLAWCKAHDPAGLEDLDAAREDGREAFRREINAHWEEAREVLEEEWAACLDEETCREVAVVLIAASRADLLDASRMEDLTRTLVGPEEYGIVKAQGEDLWSRAQEIDS